MGENIIIKHGIFYDGSTEKELEHIKTLYPDKEIVIHSIMPSEAHITVGDKFDEDSIIQ